MNTEQFLRALFAAAKDAGIGECEAYLAMNDKFDVDVLDGQVKEYTAATSSGLCFRGAYAGRMGYASTEVLDEDAVDMLVNGVKESASRLETEDDETIFEGSEHYAPLNQYREETANMPSSEKIALALALEKQVLALDPRVKRVEGCGCMSVISEKQIVNSRGLNIRFKSAMVGAAAVPIVQEGDKVNHGYKLACAFDKNNLCANAIAADAVREALSGLHARSIPSGTYRMVLRNDIAATLLATFAGVFSGESARKGLSLLKGREGEKIADHCVTLIDDPLMEDGFASAPFDAEGVAAYAKTVVDGGVLKTLLHNRTTARLLGARTTGNASKAGYTAPVRVAPSNFYIKPSETALEDLLSQVGDGVFITSLMGMHSGANAVSGDFSLGAKGFLIENGKLAMAVEQITIAGNFFELLKRVRAVAADLAFPRPGLSAFGSPALYVEQIAVAGI